MLISKIKVSLILYFMFFHVLTFSMGFRAVCNKVDHISDHRYEHFIHGRNDIYKIDYLLTNEGFDAEIYIVSNKNNKKFIAKKARKGKEKNVRLEFENFKYLKNKINNNHFILDLVDYQIDDKNEFSRNNPLLIFEKGLTDLEKFIYTDNYQLRDNLQLREIIKSMLLAIGEVHKAQMIHGDIKLSNFIIFEEKGHFIIKLADFARSFKYYDPKMIKRKEMICGFKSRSLSNRNQIKLLTLGECQHRVDLLSLATHLRFLINIISPSNFQTEKGYLTFRNARQDWIQFIDDIKNNHSLTVFHLLERSF